ncbi:MAG: chromate efflux transporter [Pseudomonadota bacterium]|nr:chromate efflux transporter [Pseudomonadota bacterium]
MTASFSAALEVFRVFLRLGLTSFGGPIAHLGYFHRELVERRRWVSDSQFSQLLAICQFLPGPASSQLGFALGLVRAGWLGALAAFLAFTLPSALLLVAFAALAPLLTGAGGSAVIHGLKIVALAVVASAVLGMGRKLCPDRPRQLIAVLALAGVLIADTAWSQLAVVLAGAVGGWLLCRSVQTAEADAFPIRHGRRAALMLAGLFAALLLGLPMVAGESATLVSVAEAFYRAGALVFGGGHVVLPLLEDSVVAPGWVTEAEFLAGYGAAQAIPGPMFAFSAYLGATIPADAPALLVAAVALLFMFLPGFLLVSAVLPAWAAVSRHAGMARAIAGVNAAVVGLLGAALYDPIFTAAITGPVDVAIAATALVLLTGWGLSPLWIVAGCVVASMAVRLV